MLIRLGFGEGNFLSMSMVDYLWLMTSTWQKLLRSFGSACGSRGLHGACFMDAAAVNGL